MLDLRVDFRPVLLITASLSCFGCDLLTPKIDADLAAGLVESLLTKEGVTAQSVECPKGQKAEKGNVFECTAKVNDVDVHFKMEVLDNKGNVMATPRDHTLVVKKIEPEIAADLQAKGHSVASIDCHGEVWVAIKDATVTCDVTDEGGAAYLWTAKFTDNEGAHEHKLEPK